MQRFYSVYPSHMLMNHRFLLSRRIKTFRKMNSHCFFFVAFPVEIGRIEPRKKLIYYSSMEIRNTQVGGNKSMWNESLSREILPPLVFFYPTKIRVEEKYQMLYTFWNWTPLHILRDRCIQQVAWLELGEDPAIRGRGVDFKVNKICPVAPGGKKASQLVILLLF